MLYGDRTSACLIYLGVGSIRADHKRGKFDHLKQYHFGPIASGQFLYVGQYGLRALRSVQGSQDFLIHAFILLIIGVRTMSAHIAV